MRTSQILKSQIKVTILWKGEVFRAEDLPAGNFLKGGVAREALMAHARGDLEVEISPRDLDLWVGMGGGVVEDWIEEGEDWRDLIPYVGNLPQEDWGEFLLEMRAVDVDINMALISNEGLLYHEEALQAIKAGEVRRVDDHLPDKRGIRAHFFAMRYNLIAIDAPLPQEHQYLSAVTDKALELGLAQEWAEYLSSQRRWRWEEQLDQDDEIEVILVEE